jgi:hypothetical protein
MNETKHRHDHVVCGHRTVEYCGVCQVVYCHDCAAEWVPRTAWPTTYNFGSSHTTGLGYKLMTNAECPAQMSGQVCRHGG